ncbi:hypothetical protein D9758_011622 [Tetrapyrgos nigripes]|uniref:DNA 3'-5' helicase n=1 Tax=Tetrapyrgos nigripes TaxID=182062 RepID=A0A8H5CUY4_9AGAR|nr:hypothetical protein D9758_011622 [Tetrapyrgos nigripes]
MPIHMSNSSFCCSQTPPTTTLHTPGTPRSPDAIQQALKKDLGLKFEPGDWQCHVIHRILKGYDSICVAATGLGKSLIFEGTAKLAGKNKLTLIICPLKALKHDQVAHTEAKGLDAIVVNEDTDKTPELWERICKTVQIVYCSPKMALSDSFNKHVWKDGQVHRQLAAVFVDEAHVIEDWGSDNFHPQYRQLGLLRPLCGYNVPFVACTATCSTSTFDTIWKVMCYGCQPFWGIDVGADHPNLLFHTRTLKNTDNPVLDALNLLPVHINTDTTVDDIDKCLFYFNSDAVYPFSSDMSETAKKHCWDGFSQGTVCIICATDAAGMGCSIPDVKYLVIFGLPASLSVVIQHWGRSGCDCVTPVVCLLLVPPWAFRLETRPAIPAFYRVRNIQENGETKANNIKWAKLEPALENFINLADQDDPCSHAFVHNFFQPKTRLDTRHSLTSCSFDSKGQCSHVSPFELSWTVLNEAKSPLSDRCCSHCSRDVVKLYDVADEHDDRLFTSAADFHFPLVSHPMPPPPLSATSSAAFQPFPSDFELDAWHKDILHSTLLSWREEWYCAWNNPFLSSALILPLKQLEELAKKSEKLLKFPDMMPDLILFTVQWDIASKADLASLVPVLDTWRHSIPRPSPTTPQSQQTPITPTKFVMTRHQDDSGTPILSLS